MDLTTLARTKQYLTGNTSANAADATYSQLIAAASGAACQFTGRTFQRTSFAGLRLNGTGTKRQMMPANPIISVSALAVDGAAYQPSADGLATGYQHDEKFLYLFGGAWFCRGLRNVVVSADVGYATSESNYVPATSPYTLTPVTGSGIDAQGAPAATSGPAMVDRGVVYGSSGAALVRVGSAPAAGQYAFSGGVYTFNAADANALVAMSYDYVPSSVEQAVIEMVGLKFQQRSLIGISSKALAGESISFTLSQQDMTPSIKHLLQPYRFVVAP